MARTLDVHLGQALVGHLVQQDGGQMRFAYASAWLERPGAFPISRSLPLQEAPFRQKACRGFFNGLLPEEANRRLIAQILRISAGNDFALLERIGGECAGALTFVPAGTMPPPSEGSYRALDDEELVEIFRILRRRPLLAGERGVRLSLAGAQDKLAVRVDPDGTISLPLEYAPSTHILKPDPGVWPGIVSNEAFCMTLARAVGLPAALTSSRRAGPIPYLLSERWDRVVTADGTIQRLHQEDFCQALGVASESKYQVEGGPGLKACFALVRAASSRAVEDLRTLLDAVFFHLLIGNDDAHAKNFALLYGPEGEARLAPMYDAVCTAHYPELDDRMAMRIGSQWRGSLVGLPDIDALARDTGLGPALTRRRAIMMAERVRDTVRTIPAEDRAAEQIARRIEARCEGLLMRFASAR